MVPQGVWGGRTPRKGVILDQIVSWNEIVRVRQLLSV